MGASRFAIPRKCEIPDGAYGVFQIPDHNIMIPLYQATTSTAQTVVDEENSATIRTWGVGRIIEDHLYSESMNGKGIWDVSDYCPDTMGFIVTPKVTFSYAVKSLCRANRQRTCFMLDGVPQWPRKSTDIMTVSCTDRTAKDVYLATWEYKGVMP